jgi:ABC-type nitrate/sulfonate/bicarbonate transport system substrate-binding protein
MSLDTLWYTRCPVPTASGIAIQLGHIDAEFASDGLDIRSLASSPDDRVRASHYLMFGTDLFRHGGNTPPIVATSRGAELTIVAFSWTYSRQPVLTLPNSGIQTAADLKGKRLALARRVNDPVDFWYYLTLRTYSKVLAAAGLTLDDVELVELPIERQFLKDANPVTNQQGALWGACANAGLQTEEALALVRGEVDAIASEAASAVNLENTLRLNVVADAAELPDIASNAIPLTFSVTTSLLDERPDLVERWLARVIEASNWAKENEREAKRIIAAEAGIPEDFVDEAYSPEVHQQLDLLIDQRSIDGLQAQADHLLKFNRIDRPVNAASLVDPAPLEAAQNLLAGHAVRS